MRKVKISPGFYLYLSAAILFLPLKWLSALVFAALVHEFGHCIALWSMKIPVSSISLELSGAKIYTEELPPKKERFAAAAGPMAGSALCLLFPLFPEVAICAMLQTLFNLLPFGSLDGKRIFYLKKD